MKIEHICNALHALAPNAEWKFNDDDLDTLEWLSDGEPPTKKEILAEIKKQEELEIVKIENQKLAKKSALVKLAALGLTEEEIAAL